MDKIETLIVIAIIVISVMLMMVIVDNCRGDIMEENPGSTFTDAELRAYRPEQLLELAAEREKATRDELGLGKRIKEHLNEVKETLTDMTQAAQPSKENIYTEQIGQCINAINEIGTHVEGIEHQIGIILEPAPTQESTGSMPDMPTTSTTNLSCHLAELASYIAKLGEHVIRLENRIIV